MTPLRFEYYICDLEFYAFDFESYPKVAIGKQNGEKLVLKEMMRNLPVPVMEEEIDEMFNFADQDRDGKISWRCPLFLLSLLLFLLLFNFANQDRNWKYPFQFQFLFSVDLSLKYKQYDTINQCWS